MQTFKSTTRVVICRHFLTSYYSYYPLTHTRSYHIVSPQRFPDQNVVCVLKFLPWTLHVLQVTLLVQSPQYLANTKYDKATHYAVFSQPCSCCALKPNYQYSPQDPALKNNLQNSIRHTKFQTYLQINNITFCEF